MEKVYKYGALIDGITEYRNRKEGFIHQTMYNRRPLGGVIRHNKLYNTLDMSKGLKVELEELNKLVENVIPDAKRSTYKHYKTGYIDMDNNKESNWGSYDESCFVYSDEVDEEFDIIVLNEKQYIKFKAFFNKLNK
ncbi:hypothetical protein PN398_07330 [Romboutsia sp. 1001216sp1]|uniref:hypothetical protein n=1 Tax=Romboutsia sp. 1001216sp1 TaxID=2986997 RepID=UPI00232ECE1D|nr:hypothetical protein [Romboutsia sp. 1001216sp1]MDB8790528.1 hypothetical protein [Romboutsia sp. 1001216sp1]